MNRYRMKLFRSRFKGRLLQDHKVCQHTGTDLSFYLLLKASFCPTDRIAVKSFLHCKSFIWKIGSYMILYGSAGHGTLHRSQSVGQLHRTVRTVADRNTLFHKGFPAVAGRCQFLSHSVFYNMIIIIQKNTLGIHMKL